MPFRQETLDEIRHRLPIEAVVGETVSLRRAGTRLVGLCPFHSEKTPSFSVSSERGLFYCFGCQAGGDLFDFVMKRDGVAFPEAVAILADKAGVSVEETQADPAQDEAFRVLEAAAGQFESLLSGPEGEAARKYLRGRGIEEPTQQAFRIGVSGDGALALQALLRQGFARASLARAGLVATGRTGRETPRFRHRIMFPVRDTRGRVIGFGGRLYLEGAMGPKYLNSPETALFSKGSLLYDLSLARRAARSAKRLLLVEGYMDVLSLYQQGVPYAVASLGTALTDRQVRLLGRMEADLFVAYDADAAGQRATERGLWLLVESGISAKVIRFPEGEDPDSFVRGGGRVEDLMGEAQPLVPYLTDRAIERHGTDEAASKGRVARAVLPGILRIPGEVERDEELRDLAERLGVREESVRAEAESLRKNAKNRNKSESRGIKWDNSRKNVPRSNLRQRAETDIIMLLARGAITPEEVAGAVTFTQSDHQSVFEALKSGVDPLTLEAPSARNLWAKASVEHQAVGAYEVLVQVIKREGMREREHELIREIGERERAGESIPTDWIAELKEIQKEINEIQEQIRGLSG